ncbi:MAG: hypothetical protein K9N09_07350 [Candidatus Cloacimonetes bacterium]|nr:hypothetical protein [Candidatus Cloacimonadota bacterium]MCF7813818.1 hypothetical protein [Candidatus Cloacimonadota bacterium]MCF7868497.1 hypothetical protein [Candidatus Cloacimonadota bacterium]
MTNHKRPLIQYDIKYYKYPTSICRGYYAKYPIENGLQYYQIEQRKAWLHHIEDLSKTKFHKILVELFDINSYFKVLNKDIDEHGIFIEGFFLKRIHLDVFTKYFNTDIEFDEFHNLLNEAWGYYVHIKKNADMIRIIKDHVYEQNYLMMINKVNYLNRIIKWYNKYKHERICKFSGKSFRIIDYPNWLYLGANGFKNCCFFGDVLESPTKKELEKLIPKFVKLCGFIPPTDFNILDYKFTSRIPNNNLNDVFELYLKMGGLDHIKQHYDTWFSAMVLTGATPNFVNVGKRGIRCVSEDGHECKSLEEKQIDDWLYRNDIIHEKEPFYPIDNDFNPRRKKRADWIVNNTYIEYLGLIGNKKYDKKTEEKISLARKLNFQLILLSPNDLENLQSKLKSCMKNKIKSDNFCELTICDQTIIRNPSNQQLEREIKNLRSRTSDYAILSFKDFDFIQTLRDPIQGFILEFQDGSYLKHYQAKNKNISLKEVVNSFISFRDKDDSWKKKFDFERIDV